MKLELNGLGKAFREDAFVLRGVDLAVDQHESVALLGASGCGKSTLIRLVAGLESPTEGEILLDGRPVRGPTPEVALVFQEPRLMPWLSVRGNIRLALEGIAAGEQERRISAALSAVGLTDFADALPKQLSGGMAQRVAVARALVREPSALLLDEPFSALDSFTRAKLQDHLTAIWREARFTLILVTHDIEEAIVVADRIVVLKGPPGRIAEDVRVDLPRPRERTSAKAQDLRRRIEAVVADR